MAMPLAIGLSVHKGLETLLKGSTLLSARAAASSEWARIWAGVETTDLKLGFQVEEGEALVNALILGWARACYNAFMEEYEVVSVEKEVSALLAPNVTLNARADAVVRRRSDGLLFVWNWKTTARKSDWTQQWEDEVQVWTEALAIEDSLGEKVQGVIMEGLYKGTFRDGLNISPLIYGYRKTVGGTTIYSPTYKAGWERFAVWRDRPLAEWINWLPESVLEEQFVRSAPILKNDAVVHDWIRQVVLKETGADHILQKGSEQDKMDYFWQNFSKNTCKWCSFRRVCRQETTIEALLEAGHLKKRVDHHAVREVRK